jgi:hypothetical protein
MAMLGLACFGWVCLALLLVGSGEGSWLSTSKPTFGGPHDVKTKSGLTSLYNERVVSVDSVTRPLNGFNREFGGIGTLKGHHAGVRVTTESGGQYLIHKGDGFGGSGGNTVVTDARYMSNNWTVSAAVFQLKVTHI